MGIARRTVAALMAVIALVSGVPQSGFAAYDGPLRVRNISPVVALYGMPRMVGARVLDATQPHSSFEASFNFEAVNNFQSKSQAGTFAFFDGETYLASYRLRGSFADRWEWGLEVPYIVHTGGGLDGVVDEFHELFGLPDGGRNLASRGRLDYFLRAKGIVYADFSNTRRSLSDVRGFAGWQLFKDETQALALRGQIKLPTGDVRDLSGSEAFDVSLWGEYERRFNIREQSLKLSLGSGVTFLGEGELVPDDQESWMVSGHIGLAWPLHRRVTLLAQLDAHSKALDTGNPLVADGGILGTLGARVGVTERLWVDLGLIEDLENESASDVVFQVLLTARF
jgi:hypothetical protein